MSSFGDVSSNSSLPYGFARFDNDLKSNTKALLDLENRLKLTQDGLKNSENSINDLKPLINNSLADIQSIYEKIENSNRDTNNSINLLNISKYELEGNISKLNYSIKELYREINISNSTQKDNFDSMSKVLVDMAKIIDDIKANSVSKSEYEAGLLSLKTLLMQEINRLKPVEEKPKDKIIEDNTTDDFRKKDKKDILSLAKNDFKSNKFELSKEKFKYLLDSNYSVSETAFYMGEIEFGNLNYYDAIKYYKRSYEANPSSSFADILLFHSGISFEETDEKVAAFNTYTLITKKYKKSQFYKPSQDKLKKLSPPPKK